MKKYFKLFLKLLVTCTLLYLIVAKIDFSNSFSLLLDVDILCFISALIIFLLCWLVNSKKWQILLSALDCKEKILSLFSLNLISSFYASILPGGQITGESIKCFKIAKNNEKRKEIIFSVLMDRVTGFIGFIILGLVGIVFSTVKITGYVNILLIFIFATIGCFLFILLFNKKIASIVEILRGKLSSNHILKKIIEVLFLYQGKYQTLFTSIFYSLLFQILNTFGVFLLALSLKIDISFLDLLWINALLGLVLILPITVLGLGLRELSLIFLLTLINIPEHQSLSLSILLSFSVFIISLSGAFVEIKKHFTKS